MENHENIKIDLKELEKFKEKNFEERLKFIDFLVDYIKKNPNDVWSAQQKKIVNQKNTTIHEGSVTWDPATVKRIREQGLIVR